MGVQLIPQKQLSQWRTAGLGAFAIIALLLGHWIVGHWPSAGGSYTAFATAVTFVGGAVAGKAATEHVANASAAAKAKEPAASILAEAAAKT
jgi:hypothetical protein